MKLIKRYAFNQCVLYKLENKRKLENILMIKRYDLKKLSKIIQYYKFFQQKEDGSPREISAPAYDLKKIQKRVLKLIERIERPEWLISGEKGKSYIDNGKRHQYSDYVLTADIKKFYDNCKREFVFKFFVDYLKTSNDIAGILSDIVTYENKIPTGSPASQLIAYYSYQGMFEDLNLTAEKHGCLFSLYVDDITFSSKNPVKLKSLINDVDTILKKHGHRLKYSKIKYYEINDYKSITGTVISPVHELLTPNKLSHKIYYNFMSTKKWDLNNDLSIEQENRLKTLTGQILAAKNIDKSVFPNIHKSVMNILKNKRKIGAFL